MKAPPPLLTAVAAITVAVTACGGSAERTPASGVGAEAGATASGHGGQGSGAGSNGGGAAAGHAACEQVTDATLRSVIVESAGLSGPPRYDGWYPRLIYGGEPDSWQPTIADVHTDPLSAKALQVGVGDVSFIVVAIDNEGDRAAYVGPAYTYYEFEQPVGARLTDEQWREMLSEKKAPQRPAFTRIFRAKPAERELPAIAPRKAPQSPDAKRLLELSRQFSNTTDPARQKRLYEQIEKLRADMARPPRSSATPE